VQVAPTPSERFALEEEWKLTEATGGQKTGAIALGLANLVGVVVLGGLLADPQTRYSLAQSSLSFVLSSFPALQVSRGPQQHCVCHDKLCLKPLFHYQILLLWCVSACRQLVYMQ